MASNPGTAVHKGWGYRHTILLVVWLLYIINYFDRISVLTFLPLIRKDLNLTHEQIGFAAAIFFFAYTCAQPSAGWLADKFGSKRVMYIAICVFTAVTFVTGFLRTYTQFILLRLGLGLGEGHHFAPASRCIADWFPKSEKGRATGFFSTTWAVAPAIIPVLVTYLAAAMGGNWRKVFFFLAIPGIVGIVILWHFISDKPETMLKKGRLTQAEYDHIHAGLVEASDQGSKKSGMGEVAKDPYIWLYTVQLFFSHAVYWGTTAWISSFLYEQHGFKLQSMGLLAAIPYAMAFFSMMLGGWLMDKVFHKLKTVALISYLVSIPILLYIGQVPKGSTTTLIVMLILNGFFVNMIWGVIYAFPQIRYPKSMVGSAVGLSGLSQLGAFVSPLAAGYLVQTTASGIVYTRVFVMFAAFFAVAATCVCFLKEELYTGKPAPQSSQTKVIASAN